MAIKITYIVYRFICCSFINMKISNNLGTCTLFFIYQYENKLHFTELWFLIYYYENNLYFFRFMHFSLINMKIFLQIYGFSFINMKENYIFSDALFFICKSEYKLQFFRFILFHLYYILFILLLLHMSISNILFRLMNIYC